jgi:hypothetical protein
MDSFGLSFDLSSNLTHRRAELGVFWAQYFFD